MWFASTIWVIFSNCAPSARTKRNRYALACRLAFLSYFAPASVNRNRLIRGKLFFSANALFGMPRRLSRILFSFSTDFYNGFVEETWSVGAMPPPRNDNPGTKGGWMETQRRYLRQAAGRRGLETAGKPNRFPPFWCPFRPKGPPGLIFLPGPAGAPAGCGRTAPTGAPEAGTPSPP